MKKYYDNDDELERALFALPLEEPPADLRASILAGTIYRQPLAVKPWEVWILGTIAALIVWLCALVIRGGAGPALINAENGVHAALVAVGQPAVLLWAAVGGAAATWFSQLNLTVSPGYQRANRR